jgi:hypothetical protein
MKTRRILRQSDFAHLCQAKIIYLNGKAQAKHNRFGGN